MKCRLVCLLSCFLMALATAEAQENKNVEDMEKLERAVEYFQSGKYHEARILFENLSKKHALNPRFRAYMGFCAFHDWDYEATCNVFDELLPQLGMLDPHELSLYYFCNAESHFNLQEYQKAIPFYEQHLLVCYPSERADSWYRIGFCHMFLEAWEMAAEAFESSLSYYGTFLNDEQHKARIMQIEKMVKGCRQASKEQGQSVLQNE